MPVILEAMFDNFNGGWFVWAPIFNGTRNEVRVLAITHAGEIWSDTPSIWSVEDF